MERNAKKKKFSQIKKERRSKEKKIRKKLTFAN